jgi:hypothetical protein
MARPDDDPTAKINDPNWGDLDPAQDPWGPAEEKTAPVPVVDPDATSAIPTSPATGTYWDADPTGPVLGDGTGKQTAEPANFDDTGTYVPVKPPDPEPESVGDKLRRLASQITFRKVVGTSLLGIVGAWVFAQGQSNDGPQGDANSNTKADKADSKVLEETPKSPTTKAIESHESGLQSTPPKARTQSTPAQAQPTQQATPQQTQTTQPPAQSTPAPEVLGKRAPGNKVMAVNGKADPALGVGINRKGEVALFRGEKSGSWVELENTKLAGFYRITTHDSHNRYKDAEPSTTIDPSLANEGSIFEIAYGPGHEVHTKFSVDFGVSASTGQYGLLVANDNVNIKRVEVGSLPLGQDGYGTPSASRDAPDISKGPGYESPVSFRTTGKSATDYSLS